MRFHNEQETAVENNFPDSCRKVFYKKGLDKSVCFFFKQFSENFD